jgi:hypothetical protein
MGKREWTIRVCPACNHQQTDPHSQSQHGFDCPNAGKAPGDLASWQMEKVTVVER